MGFSSLFLLSLTLKAHSQSCCSVNFCRQNLVISTANGIYVWGWKISICRFWLHNFITVLFVFLMLLYSSIQSLWWILCSLSHYLSDISEDFSEDADWEDVYVPQLYSFNGLSKGSWKSQRQSLFLCPCMPLTLELHMWTEIDGWP